MTRKNSRYANRLNGSKFTNNSFQMRQVGIHLCSLNLDVCGKELYFPLQLLKWTASVKSEDTGSVEVLQVFKILPREAPNIRYISLRKNKTFFLLLIRLKKNFAVALRHIIEGLR